jgi:positive regulator of sigma E activity
MSEQFSDLETGTVIGVEGDCALVELSVQAACDACGARVICVPDTSGRRRIKVSNPLNAQIGNRVAISEASQFLLKLSVLQYGIPLLGFLVGIFSIHFSNMSLNGIPDEVIAFLGGVAGLIGGAFFSRYWANRIAEQDSHFFTICKIFTC